MRSATQYPAHLVGDRGESVAGNFESDGVDAAHHSTSSAPDSWTRARSPAAR